MRHLLLGMAAALACGSVSAEIFSGVVTHVSDGDTLWLQRDHDAGKPIKMRVQGIDAPERCQAWGAQSTAALEARVLHRRVVVDARATDDYQRSLVTLRLAGEDIGAWMVTQGHAWSYRYRRSAGPYATQEQQARAAQRGLFADAQAIEPRVFRKQHGPCE